MFELSQHGFGAVVTGASWRLGCAFVVRFGWVRFGRCAAQHRFRGRIGDARRELPIMSATGPVVWSAQASARHDRTDFDELSYRIPWLPFTANGVRGQGVYAVSRRRARLQHLAPWLLGGRSPSGFGRGRGYRASSNELGIRRLARGVSSQNACEAAPIQHRAPRPLGNASLGLARAVPQTRRHASDGRDHGRHGRQLNSAICAGSRQRNVTDD